MKLNLQKFGMIVFLMTQICFAVDQGKGLICVPVSNLYIVPKKISSELSLPLTRYENPRQLSQLLFGEQVAVHKQFKDDYNQKWLYVSALQQDIMPKSDGYQRRPCPGWILAEDIIVVNYPVQQNIVVSSSHAPLLDESGLMIMMLSIGSRLSGDKVSDSMWSISMPDGTNAYIADEHVYNYTNDLKESLQQLREGVIRTAKKFVNSYYSWGGRSAQSACWHPSSVDCSGLVNISFLAQGLHIPKNSHSQYLSCHYIKIGRELQPGDVVFMAPKRSGMPWMSHVMLYAGDDRLLEAAASAQKVQEITFLEKFGKSHDELQSGDVVTQLAAGKDYTIYFGSYFVDDVSVQKLRSDMFIHVV